MIRAIIVGFWLLVMVFLIGCQPAAIQSLPQVSEPTLVPTAAFLTNTPTQTATLLPTRTPTRTTVPTLTQTRRPTRTVTSAPTPIQTAVPSATATMTPSPENHEANGCPEPAPLKPDYTHYFLSPKLWPTPDRSNLDSHFWLGKPLPGGGRLLINQTYPYGFDGDGRYLLHNGIDAAEKLGTPVLAVADGTVIVAQSDENQLFGWRCDWYGQLVILQLDQTWQGQPMFALYGHVLNIAVEVGQRVALGEQVAEVGFGGAALVPHLHFELRIGENEFDATRNPLLWISPGSTRGVIVGRLTDPEGRPWQGVVITLIGPDGEANFINSYTYLDDPGHLINPDEWYAENFVFSDILPGEYTVFVKLQGIEYRVPIEVRAGEMSFVEVVTEPYKSE